MGRQHFAVRVDIHALARRLLQQQLQVVEIMAGDDDERPLLHRQRNGHGRGCAIALGVGLVQQRHALEVLFADLHHDGQQLVHAPVLAYGKKCFSEEAVYLLIGIAQYHGVMCICRHATHTEKDQGF